MRDRGATRNFISRLTLCACFAVAASDLDAQNDKFLEAAAKRIHKEFGHSVPELKLADVCPVETDQLARRVFWEYGSIFVADKDVRIPNRCIFSSPSAVQIFQGQLETRKEVIGITEIELQSAAMDSLMKAIREAGRRRLSITPLDGSIAGKRSFEDTVRLWNSRFYRALDHWVERGRIEKEEAIAARNSPVELQVKRVVEWEAEGLYFSTNFSKSIFYSVAPPGTSQHLSLLAFDIVEADDPRIRAILNSHGWYQTIRTDKPHFTYLGVSVSDLPNRGLKHIYYGGTPFWIPSGEPVAINVSAAEDTGLID